MAFGKTKLIFLKEIRSNCSSPLHPNESVEDLDMGIFISSKNSHNFFSNRKNFNSTRNETGGLGEWCFHYSY